MVKVIDLQQNTPEWKEWRRWKIGASLAPVIMGVSPFQTKLQLWETILLEKETIPNAAMIRGASMEAKARDWLNEHYSDYGLRFQPACLQDDHFPWMIASLDGWISSSYVARACEIKCPGQEAHLIALNGEVPAYYMPQLQHQMYVAQIDEILYVSFDGENGVVLTVKKDWDYINNQLIPQETSFYESLLNFKAPEASDKDIVTIADPEAISDALLYENLLQEIGMLEKSAEECKARLIIAAKHGRAKIGKLKIMKIMRKGAVDYEKIPELKCVNLEKFRKSPVESWRVTVSS